MNIVIKKTCLVMLCVFIGIFSVTKFSNVVTNPEFKFNKTNIESFDDKINTVMGLSGGAALASTAISLIPGDAGTPIANELAEFSKYFLIIMSALFFEQYFVVISGFIVSYLIIPAICLLAMLYILFENKWFKNLAIKVFLVGMILYAIVPCTVKVTTVVSKACEDTISVAENNELATENLEDARLIKKLTAAAETTVQNASDYVSQLIRALAVMIVITCLIPILMLVIAFWLLKIVMTQNASIPLFIKRDTLDKLE